MFFLELHVSTIDYRKSVPSAVAELISMMTTYDEVDPALSRLVLTCHALGDYNSHPVITDQKSRLV